MLVPIDLSPLSDRVVRRAVSLPIAAGGTITLLHVVPKRLRVGALRREEQAARTSLARHASHASKVRGADISIEHAVRAGVATAEIAKYAARSKADLVVMGRGTERPLRDSFLGSTAERVIRQARMSVLAVRSPVRGPYRRPTLGLDLDDAAEPVLAMLLRVIPPPRPRITIVHAHDSPYFGRRDAGPSDDESGQEDQWYRKTAVLRLGALIARGLGAQGKEPDDVLDFNTYIRRGHPRVVIKSAVRKLNTDILLLGTHGRSGVAHVFLGTVAGDVLREVPCDVLVVPPRRPRSRRG